MARRDWGEILEHAAAIVESYATEVTLRQLFYRLVADQTLRNTRSEYGQLSSRTAQARRDGWFPGLIDKTRDIERPQSFSSTEDAKSWLKARYQRDRTEGQEYSVYVGVEKAGIVNQLWSWFSKYHIPILALSGYSSQSFVDQVVEDVYAQDRPSVLIYAGDFDPSGEDIDRDFLARTGCWDEFHRIALSVEQVTQYNLPPAMGKSTDSRASAFMAKHGTLVQVELDAIPPDILQRLYTDQVMEHWDMAAWESIVDIEREERDSL
jgi:hypothetical protein